MTFTGKNMGLKKFLRLKLITVHDEHFFLIQTNWVVVESGGLFCKPAEMEGEKFMSDIGEEMPAGTVPLEDITANAIAYYGFYIPLRQYFFCYD